MYRQQQRLIADASHSRWQHLLTPSGAPDADPSRNTSSEIDPPTIGYGCGVIEEGVSEGGKRMSKELLELVKQQASEIAQMVPSSSPRL